MSNKSVILRVNKTEYSGWLDVNINRSLEQISGEFTVSAVLPSTATAPDILRGYAVEVEISGQRVITGWVRSVDSEATPDSLSLSITGRDKTGDLVDCSAVHPSGSWSGRTLQQIAAELCSPFGIGVHWQVTDARAGQPFATFKLDHGETVHDALSRAARHRGVILTSDVYGNVVFTEPGIARTDALELGKNLLRCKYTDDDSDRFSVYRILGDHAAGGQLGDSMTTAQVASVAANVIDSGVTRYRPKITIADHNVDAGSARDRAQAELAQAIAKGQRVEVTVRNWRRESGELWQFNQLTTVTSKPQGLNHRELLIVAIAFSLDDSEGEVCTQTLAYRDGYIVPVEPDKAGKGKGKGSPSSFGMSEGEFNTMFPGGF